MKDSSWHPSKTRKINARCGIEHNALLFEKTQLQLEVFGLLRKTDLSVRVDHAMPGNAAAGRERAQRVADSARLSGNAGKLCNLPVRGYSAARDAVDDVVDGIVADFHFIHSNT